MTSQAANIARRAGDFLDLVFPGPHKSKRVAQRFEISPAMAKLLRSGEGWTAHRIGQAAAIFGRDFVAFVFQDQLGPQRPYEPHPEIAALEQAVARLKARIGGDDGLVAPAADRPRVEATTNVDAEGRASGVKGEEVGSSAVALGRRTR